MTTAARPTFEPAKGGMGRGERDLSALSKQYSSRDLPAHTRLKYREHGQASSEELRSRDFRRELEEKEKHRGISSHSRDSHSTSHSKKPRLEAITPNLDADDPIDDDDGDARDDDNDDSDDESALYAELERIRKERAEEEMRRERERAEQEERIRMENIISGNPLLNIVGTSAKSDMKVNRRWDDDVVFKNCAATEPKVQKTFINDSLRSDFHKRFMEKYVK